MNGHAYALRIPVLEMGDYHCEWFFLGVYLLMRPLEVKVFRKIYGHINLFYMEFFSYRFNAVEFSEALPVDKGWYPVDKLKDKHEGGNQNDK